jgi:hypothetical protein
MSGWDSSKEGGPVGNWGGDGSWQAAAGGDAGGSAACSSMIPEICPPSPSRTAQQLPSLYTAAGRPRAADREDERERGTSQQQQEKQLSKSCNRWEIPSKNPNLTWSLTNPHAPTHRRHTPRSSLRLFFKTYSAICACSCLLS